jgi:RecA-family ATPase
VLIDTAPAAPGVAHRDVENTAQFLRLILPSEGWLCAALKTPKGFLHKWFPPGDFAGLADCLLKADQQGLTTYFACASYADPKAGRRRENVDRIKALWIDVDVKGDDKVHALRMVFDFCKSRSLPFPIVVDSGGGWHCYFPLDEEITKQQWYPYANGLRTALQQAGVGFDPAPICNSAAILRPPGSHNRKLSEPRPVRVNLAGAAVYDLVLFPRLEIADRKRDALSLDFGALPGFLRDVAPLTHAGVGIDDYAPSDPHLIANECAQIGRMRETGGKLPEPLWSACLGALAFCENGDEYGHEWSKGDERYRPDETQGKLDRKRELSGPTTCEHFQGLNPKGCACCPHKGRIRTPVALGRAVYGASEPRLGPIEKLVANGAAPEAGSNFTRNGGTDAEPPTFQQQLETGARLHALGVVSVAAFQGKPIPPRKWLVADWIPWGVVTGLYGDGGMGKSLLTMQLQTAIALGKPWIGLAVCETGASLGVYCEDALDELIRRQADINTHYGCGFDDVKAAHWWPHLGEDNMLMAFARNGKGELTTFHRQLREAALDLKAKLLIIDTLMDTFGGNENDRAQVRQYVQVALGSLARAIDGCVILNAHPSRSGMATGSGDGGSTAWSNAFRSRLYNERPEAELGEFPDPQASVLSRKKANYAARDDSIRLRWQQGVIVPYAPFGRQDSAPSAGDVFLRLLDTLAEEGRSVSPNDRASNYAPRLFAQRPERCGYGSADFARAMERLFACKAIVIEEYRQDYKPRQRLVRAKASID